MNDACLQVFDTIFETWFPAIHIFMEENRTKILLHIESKKENTFLCLLQFRAFPSVIIASLSLISGGSWWVV
jgi:hypothetical protein